MSKAGKNIHKLRRKMAGQIKYFLFSRFAVPPNLFFRLPAFAAPPVSPISNILFRPHSNAPFYSPGVVASSRESRSPPRDQCGRRRREPGGPQICPPRDDHHPDAAFPRATQAGERFRDRFTSERPSLA